MKIYVKILSAYSSTVLMVLRCSIYMSSKAYEGKFYYKKIILFYTLVSIALLLVLCEHRVSFKLKAVLQPKHKGLYGTRMSILAAWTPLRLQQKVKVWQMWLDLLLQMVGSWFYVTRHACHSRYHHSGVEWGREKAERREDGQGEGW